METIFLRSLAFLPLLGPAALAVVGLIACGEPGPRPRNVLRASRIAGWLAIGLAVFAGWLTALHGPLTSPLFGISGWGFAVRLDALSALIFGLVAFLGGVLLRFSRNYLDGDARQGAFMGNLCVTIAAVMLLILSGNLFQLVLTWVATSLALHRLLEFYPDRPGAVIAARKKFIAARIGDGCLILAVIFIARAFGTADIGLLLERAGAALESGSVPDGVHLATILLALTAALKSAQFPTHGWLIEVMETPTPVSALLHAGILNGGVFLIARLAPVMTLSTPAMLLLALIGGGTALFASVAAISQTSIKIYLAYSSAAHMGFMLFLSGMGAFPPAMLHLVAHSFYKAHAFLSAGSAVDLARASGATPKDYTASPLLLLVSMTVALSAVIGIGSLAGVHLLEQPVELGLAFVLAVGLAYILAQALSGAPSQFVVARTALSAQGVAVAFFLLELGFIHLLEGTLPMVSTAGLPTLALLGLIAAVFGAACLAQVFIPAAGSSPRWAAAYVHLRNGLYANAVYDRWIGALRQFPKTPTQPGDQT